MDYSSTTTQYIKTLIPFANIDSLTSSVLRSVGQAENLII